MKLCASRIEVDTFACTLGFASIVQGASAILKPDKKQVIPSQGLRVRNGETRQTEATY